MKDIKKLEIIFTFFSPLGYLLTYLVPYLLIQQCFGIGTRELIVVRLYIPQHGHGLVPETVIRKTFE